MLSLVLVVVVVSLPSTEAHALHQVEVVVDVAWVGKG